MDFTPTPEQTDAAALAAQVFGDRCTPERHVEAERNGRFDRALWAELGPTGLLGLSLPEEYGGAGLGVLELTSVLEEAGKVVAPVPLVPHVTAATVLACFGSAGQRSAWLADSASGASILTVAVAEDHAALPEQPVTSARPDGNGWTLTGAKTAVLGGTEAQVLLVPAATDDGVRVFVVQPSDTGVTVTAQQLSGQEQAARVELDGVHLGEDRVLGAAADTYLSDLFSVGLAAFQLGVCEGALRLTADYARTREQFGRPIGTFQAVSQRLADCFIDVRGFRLIVTQAAWRLSEQLPADVEVAAARLWAAETGHRVAHSAVHIHGGVGIDLDGPAHRYFTGAKRLEFLLGGVTLQARSVGRALAAEPV